VTAPQSRQFGSLMSAIDTQRLTELGEVWSRRKPAPGLAELCEISFQMANSDRVLRADHRGCRVVDCDSSEQLVDHACARQRGVGQGFVAAGVFEREGFVLQAQLMQDG